MKSGVLSLRRKEAISQSGVTNYGSQNRRGLISCPRLLHIMWRHSNATLQGSRIFLLMSIKRTWYKS
jgi:hypothetical protein